jgi:cytochrome c biogenesis protein CcmG/thiol:disulfide interchange protein DsbE
MKLKRLLMSSVPLLSRLASICALIGASACVPAMAYSVGDAVDPAILSRLQIDPAKVTVIDFFAEWCISCRKELPLISAVHGRLDKAKVDFVGIDTNDSLSAAEAFQRDMRAKGALSFRAINDPEQNLVGLFKPKGYPALYILKGGKVVAQHLGALPNVDALLDRELKSLGVN